MTQHEGSSGSEKLSTLRRLASAHPLMLRKVLEGDRCLTPIHLVVLSEILAQTMVKQNLRLILNLHPRAGKSQLISHWFPVWYLRQRPEHRVMLSTYEASFAAMWGRKVRDSIEEHREFLGISVSDKSAAADLWETPVGGGMKTAGVGGPLTGFGADCLTGDTWIKTSAGDMCISQLVAMENPPKVLSYDFNVHALVNKPVVATRKTVSGDLYEVKTKRGYPITCTGNHRFYVRETGEWAQAKDLKKGDILLRPMGKDSVVSVTPVQVGGAVEVFDIQVQDTHCFYANSILVHNCLIIDDPHKNAEEANSQVIRDKVWDWWTSTASTRMQPGANCILVQCLAGETRVPLSDGRWVFIKDIRAGDYVFAFDGTRFVKRKVLAQRLSGVDDTLKIKTVRHTISANARHPFLVVPNPKDRIRPQYKTEWRLAGDLKKGDLVVTAAELPTGTGNAPVAGWDTPERLWFLGFMFGDGWVTSWERNNKTNGKVYKSRSWAVYAALKVSEETNERVADMFESAFGRRPARKLKERYWRLDSNRAGREMEELGLKAGAGARGKKLPAWVFAMSTLHQQAFLRGFIAADGSKNKKGFGYTLASVNQELIEDAKRLAFLCGVRPTNTFRYPYTLQPPNSPKPVSGFICSAHFTFPQDVETRNPSLVSGNVPPDVRIEKITSVENDIKQDVYDISVDGEANFVAEGFCTHNTRWHMDDLTGRLLQHDKNLIADGLEPEGWIEFTFPAIAENLGSIDGVPVRDPLGRVDGEAMWPEQFPVNVLRKIERRVGPVVWNALYQQRPTAADGDAFKRSWIEPYRYTIERKDNGDPYSDKIVLAPRLSLDNPAGAKYQSFEAGEMETFLVADTAMTVKKESDPSCICVFWKSPRRHLILKEMFHGRLTAPDVEKKILEMYRRNNCLFMAVEAKNGGLVAVQRFIDMDIAVKPLKAISDKLTRSAALQIMMEQGKVWHPAPGFGLPEHLWNTMVDEFVKFPRGTHDDIVDTYSYAAMLMTLYTYDTDGPPAVIDMVEAEHSDEASLL